MKTFRSLSILMLSLTVLFATGCASTRTQSSLGEAIDDTVITTRVKAAFIEDPDLKVLEINVETFKGAVQLSGFVDTSTEVRRAAVVARAVDGVVSVTNDIQVK
jgi:osmotically-inducible protein OsmY